MSDTDDSHLRLIHDDPGTATFKRGRTMEENFLVQMMKAGGNPTNVRFGS